MIFRRFHDPDLSQTGFLLGCPDTREAIAVDPRRDVAAWLDCARAENLQIIAVTETHIHADYLSGARELASRTGSRLFLSREGGPDWLYRFPHEALYHGSTLTAGRVRLEAVHTPGHTPEHLSFLVTDTGDQEAGQHFLSGDFVFVGDLGRPDLLDEAAGGTDTRFPAARTLFRSLKEKFLTLPAAVRVWPGHGAGSACGRNLGSEPSTTVGQEKLSSWWAPYVEAGDEDGFVAELLRDQPDAPWYFSRMKTLNRAGPDLRGAVPALSRLDVQDVQDGEFLIIDARTDAQAGSSPAGALRIPGSGRFATHAAWVLDPEDGDAQDIVLLADSTAAAERLCAALLRIGIDRVAGFLTDADARALSPAEDAVVEPAALDTLGGAMLLDIRTVTEHEAGHIPGSRRIGGGAVLKQLNELPRDRPIVVYCQSGGRVPPVVSALRRSGYDARELRGSYVGWLFSGGASG